MLRLRLFLAVCLTVIGAFVIVRIVEAVGLRLEILPGVVLGGAMVALGVHRVWLILRMRGAT